MAIASKQFHEDLNREPDVRGPSDRSFGLVFGGAFLVIGLWPLWKGRPPRIWALVLSGLFLVVSMAYPSLLHSLNRLWTRFGLLLGLITNPIITALLFVVVFVPAGLVLRLLGKDLLRLRSNPGASSYWIRRDPPGPDSESMVDQF